MVKRLARFMLPLACVGALAATAAPASAKLTVGIGDNGYAMFTQPLFQQTTIKTARLIVFWNVAVLKNKSSLNYTRSWLNAAQKAGVQPLISFGGNGNYIPTAGQYTTAVRAFIKDFPKVKLYTAWNEPDWVFRSLSKKPALAASYFNALVRYCKGCTVAAGELYRNVKQGLGSWIRAYQKALKSKPKVWALHNYDDVRTHTTSQLKTLQHYIGRGPQIWLTEISGLIRRGHWPYPNQTPAKAAIDERFLFALPKRNPQITRIYHYQWQGTVDTPATGWDSGLIGPTGAPRPAYAVVNNAAHGKLT